MKKIKIFVAFIFSVLVFATGCSLLPMISNGNTSSSSSSSVTKEYYDMSGVSFNGASYVYDGEEHSLSIEGTLPDGVSVMYLNNNKVNAGTYEVTAKFTGDSKNYHPIFCHQKVLFGLIQSQNILQLELFFVLAIHNPH